MDGQALETLFDDPTLTAGLGLSGAGTASSLLFTQISQEVSVRKVRMDGYMKRGADVIVPNIALCGGGLAVHVMAAALVPAAAFYSTVESLIVSTPELSITAEAYFITRELRESFLVSPLEQGQVSAQQQAIIIPPLFPSGTLPNPILPDAGMCQPGEVIDGFNVQTVFAPTNLAWKNFFRRVGLSKEQVFSDQELLLSTLQYSEVFSTPETPPIGADGVLAGARYFTYNMYPLEILQSSVNPELLFVLPLLGPGLGALNFFDLIVDITCVGNKRFVTLEGQGSPCSGETRRSCSCRTLSRVTGCFTSWTACSACSHDPTTVVSPPRAFTFHSNSNQSRKRVARAGAGYSRNARADRQWHSHLCAHECSC